jgi:hypothetical protein
MVVMMSDGSDDAAAVAAAATADLVAGAGGVLAAGARPGEERVLHTLARRRQRGGRGHVRARGLLCAPEVVSQLLLRPQPVNRTAASAYSGVRAHCVHCARACEPKDGLPFMMNCEVTSSAGTLVVTRCGAAARVPLAPHRSEMWLVVSCWLNLNMTVYPLNATVHHVNMTVYHLNMTV